MRGGPLRGGLLRAQAEERPAGRGHCPRRWRPPRTRSLTAYAVLGFTVFRGTVPDALLKLSLDSDQPARAAVARRAEGPRQRLQPLPPDGPFGRSRREGPRLRRPDVAATGTRRTPGVLPAPWWPPWTCPARPPDSESANSSPRWPASARPTTPPPTRPPARKALPPGASGSRRPPPGELSPAARPVECRSPPAEAAPRSGRHRTRICEEVQYVFAEETDCPGPAGFSSGSSWPSSLPLLGDESLRPSRRIRRATCSSWPGLASGSGRILYIGGRKSATNSSPTAPIPSAATRSTSARFSSPSARAWLRERPDAGGGGPHRRAGPPGGRPVGGDHLWSCSRTPSRSTRGGAAVLAQAGWTQECAG